MAPEAQPKPSFSPYTKWRIGLHVILVTLLVLSVVVMLNYLGRDYFFRLHVGTSSLNQLSPVTVKLVESITNRIRVTVYFDHNDQIYPLVISLLKEYKLLNPKITVETIDYLRDSGAAQRIKAEYKLNAPTDKDMVIFDCEGRIKMVDAKGLADYVAHQVPSEKGPRFQSKATVFKGELVFTGMLLGVLNTKPLKSYFLQGHGEHDITSGDDVEGYAKFAEVLHQNFIQIDPISLLGTNQVPMDCSLLIIAGPRTQIPEIELEKIDQYLSQGGRLLALFNAYTANRETGLEKILAKFGVDVGRNIIKDPDRTALGSDVIVSDFGKHPTVTPLVQSSLYLIQPRSVGRAGQHPPGGATKVQEIAFTGPRAYVAGNPRREPHRFPLMAAVEQGDIKGVITERGSTRMIIAGDSIFLANRPIDSVDNRAFAGYAVNWLLDRSQLVPGVGTRAIPEYRLIMTQGQMRQAQWVLLGAMPGAILLLGGLVWLRRRR